MTRTTPPRYAATLGLLAALGLTVAGCAGASSQGGAGSAPAAASRQLRITVTGKQDDPAPRVVDLGVGHTLSQPGLYEVEMHHPDLRLLQVAVR